MDRNDCDTKELFISITTVELIVKVRLPVCHKHMLANG